MEFHWTHALLLSLPLYSTNTVDNMDSKKTSFMAIFPELVEDLKLFQQSEGIPTLAIDAFVEVSEFLNLIRAMLTHSPSRNA